MTKLLVLLLATLLSLSVATSTSTIEEYEYEYEYEYEAPLSLYEQFHRATGGEAWNKCKNNAANPCRCNANMNKLVVCNNGNVKTIKLQSNNLVGEFPEDLIDDLLADTVNVVNLKGNEMLVLPAGADCVTVPQCFEAKKSCQFDFDVCPLPPTEAPSPNPSASLLPPLHVPHYGCSYYCGLSSVD